MENLTMITTILVALITAVLGPVVVAWAKTKLERKKEKTPMGEALESSSLIDDQLKEIMEELDYDRVWVAQFHNGGHFYPTGKSIQKFSIFYERCNPSIPHIQSTFQNIPVSLFPKVLSKVYKEGELEILNVETEENSFGISALTSNFKTTSICMVGLRSLDGHLIGIMGISFINERNLVKDDWIVIRQKEGIIGTLLSNYLYKQKS